MDNTGRQVHGDRGRVIGEKDRVVASGLDEQTYCGAIRKLNRVTARNGSSPTSGRKYVFTRIGI
jgi:hypothetical protein